MKILTMTSHEFAPDVVYLVPDFLEALTWTKGLLHWLTLYPEVMIKDPIQYENYLHSSTYFMSYCRNN